MALLAVIVESMMLVAIILLATIAVVSPVLFIAWALRKQPKPPTPT